MRVGPLKRAYLATPKISSLGVVTSDDCLVVVGRRGHVKAMRHVLPGADQGMVNTHRS
jgi:hypothetical protein